MEEHFDIDSHAVGNKKRNESCVLFAFGDEVVRSPAAAVAHNNRDVIIEILFLYTSFHRWECGGNEARCFPGCTCPIIYSTNLLAGVIGGALSRTRTPCASVMLTKGICASILDPSLVASVSRERVKRWWASPLSGLYMLLGSRPFFLLCLRKYEVYKSDAMTDINTTQS